MLRHLAAGTTTAAIRGSEPGSRYAGARSRGPVPQLFLTLCVAATMLAVFTGAALAAQTRSYTGTSFGPDGVGGAESFAAVQSIAVDQTSGDVFVYDGGAAKVYKFNSAGAPLKFSGLPANAIEVIGGGGGAGELQVAVAPAGSPGGTAGDIYVANNVVVKIYSPPGAFLGEIEGDNTVNHEACGVAVNPAGHLFIGFWSKSVREFVPAANPPTAADATATGTANIGLCNVAADGLGNVYATEYTGDKIAKLEGIDDASPTVIQPGARTIGIDPVTNDLLADRGSVVAQYAPDGTPDGTFGSGQLEGSRGIAVSGVAEKAYAGDGVSGKVKIFGAPVVIPGVSAATATGITTRRAILHGTVNPAGLAVGECEFEYGTGGGPSSTVPCEGAIPTDESNHQVSAEIAGLNPNQTYFVRLIAGNANGTNSSEGPTFTTLAKAMTEPAGDLTNTSATLNGLVAPGNEAVSECFFEYGETQSYGATVPCVGAIPSDEAQHPVSAAINDLSREHSYHFRLVLKQAGGESFGADRVLATAGAAIASPEATHIGTDHATLEAEINPRGSVTSYFFEYGPTTAYGSATEEVALGDDEAFHAVAETIEGLTLGTTYHWRVVIIDSFGEAGSPDRSFRTHALPGSPETGCSNQLFRTYAGGTLPDCRAYELASPLDKGGLNVEGFPDYLAAAADGSGVTFFSQGGTGIPSSGGGHQEFLTYLSSRVGDSWSTQRLSSPESFGNKAYFRGTSPDMRFALIEAIRTGSGPGTGAGLFLLDTTQQSLTPIVNWEDNQFDAPNYEGSANYFYDSISADGDRVFFEALAPLTENAAPDKDNLYMWDRASGEVSLVGVLPGNPEEAPPGGSFGGAYAWFLQPNFAQVGGAGAGLYVETAHAATSDGDQIYFTAGEAGQLYLRRGLNGSQPETTHVSAPESGVSDPFGPQLAAFQEATPDGSRAFFLSSEKLTTDATTSEFDEGKDLYRFDRSTSSLVDVTPDTSDPNGAEVRGLMGIAEDGSSGYLVAGGVLASGGTVGENNVYRFSERPDGTFDLTFVARLANGSEDGGGFDRRNWSPQTFENGTVSEDFAIARTARVTPDGESLVYVSRAITGRPKGACGNFVEDCSEVYRYSAATDTLACISCNPSGEGPFGPAELATQFLNAHLTPKPGTEAVMARSVSVDGDHIFFQTPDSLVAEDTNGDEGCPFRKGNHRVGPACLDVYEWEAADAAGGSCHAAEVGSGCLYLLSTGKSKDPSYFVDASTDGSSAFIATTSQLVPVDKDELYDVYAVKVDGGLAAQQVDPTPACSSASACHGGSASPSSGASPGSASFNGPGNQKPQRKSKRCRKKGGGHCGKKKKARHHHKKSKQHRKANRQAAHSATVGDIGGAK